MMKSTNYFSLIVLWISLIHFCHSVHLEHAVHGVHSAPAVPLITLSPYVSIWSSTPTLADDVTRHWTGSIIEQINALIKIDGKGYRLVGAFPSDVPILHQVCDSFLSFQTPTECIQDSIAVRPTQTIVAYSGNGVSIKLKFTTPALLDNLEAFSKPVTWIDIEANPLDGKNHSVTFYYDQTAQICLGDQATKRKSLCSELSGLNGLTGLTMGAINQTVLEAPGDWMAITWGHAYIAGTTSSITEKICSDNIADTREQFIQSGTLDSHDTFPVESKVSGVFDKAAAEEYRAEVESRLEKQRAYGVVMDDEVAEENEVLMGSAVILDLGVVSSRASLFLVFAYDEVASMNYFGHILRPAWASVSSIGEMIQWAVNTHDDLVSKCEAFDTATENELLAVGGEDYAYLASLVYRQVTASLSLSEPFHLLESEEANPDPYSGRLFMKEISSDGDVNTVDVIYPASPFFLKFNYELLWQIILPVMEYANNYTYIKYNLTWAPHHLGVWPYCNTKPMEQEQMPNEETANLFLMIAAIAQRHGNIEFLKPYLDSGLVQTWVAFLVENAVDPGNQLCSDDFEGPSPHNSNLALKSILGLAAYSIICDVGGNSSEAEHYMNIAKEYALKWEKLANDGDHYNLEYDKPHTWSQKYNLVWERILNMSVFSKSRVVDKELEYYKTKRDTYGVPLDSRKSWAKADWSSWIGALGNDTDFRDVISDLVKFADHSLKNWPLGDWYYSADPGWPLVFRARPVVGAFFAKLLV